MLSKFFKNIHHELGTRITISELNKLSDRQLSDIGFNRNTLKQVVRKY